MKKIFFSICIILFCASISSAQMVNARVPVSYSKVAPTLRPILGTTSHLWYNSSVSTSSALQVYDRIAGTWYAAAVKKVDASAALDFGSVNSNLTSELGIRVPGAVAGEKVILGLPSNIPAGGMYNARATTDTVWIRYQNATAGAVNPSSGTFSVTIIR